MQGVKLNAHPWGGCACPACLYTGSGLAGLLQGDSLRGTGVPEQMQCSHGATLVDTPHSELQPCCVTEGGQNRRQRGGNRCPGDMRELSPCAGAAPSQLVLQPPGWWDSEGRARSHRRKRVVPLAPSPATGNRPTGAGGGVGEERGTEVPAKDQTSILRRVELTLQNETA